MDPLEQLKQVSQGVSQFHAGFVESIADVQDEGMRQYMTALAGRIKELQGQVEATFPKALATIQQEAAAAQEENALILQQAEVLKAKQAEAQAQAEKAARSRAEAAAQAEAQLKAQAAEVPVPPPAPPLPLMTSRLSQLLREELLARYGMRQAHRHKPIEYQEAGEDWRDPAPVEQPVVPGW